uniref:Uncharacterized protein n=1 Tax=Rhizophora mucronata TaxID=61149 RepID=A0A2P2MNY2_RHIMU
MIWPNYSIKALKS